MKFTQFIAASALAALASAHSRVWSIEVDGVSQGNGLNAGGYIRSPPNNNPLKDLASTDLRCNVNGGTAAAKTLTVKAGSKITFQWYHDVDSASDDIIDPSHKGPVMVYIAPTSSNGAGNVWVKLAEEGYSGGKWAVDNLIANRGKHSLTLPAALANGNYLLRPEIIASHESDTAFNANPARGAQLYMACIQITVTGGGAATLPAGAAIPGMYSYADPGIVFNLYSSYTSYPIPGPKVWTPSAGSAPAPATTLKTTTKAAAATTAVVVQPTTTKAPVVVTTTKAAATTAVVVKPTTTKAAVPTTTKAAATPVKPTTAPAATGVSGTAAKWGQCGGIGYTGPKTCVAGTTCKFSNDWYSQCL